MWGHVGLQGSRKRLDVAGCHVKAGHRERRTCGGTTLSRPNRKTLEGGTPDHRILGWDERSWSHVCAGIGVELVGVC